MSQLRELYQEIIIDHGRHPRNFGPLACANFHKEGYNPLCGDKILLHVEIDKNFIKKIAFEGEGCAISMASASLLTETLMGKTLSEAETIFLLFHDLVRGELISEENIERLGKLSILKGISEYPTRIKCATLAWHTLRGISSAIPGVISTEGA